MTLMTDQTKQILQGIFPNLFNHYVSPNVSPPTNQYNCIAWAYGIDTDRFWPNLYGFSWPPGITNEETVESFIQLYKSIGYEECNNSNLEEGFLKVAIFTLNGKPKHAARQLPDGYWTSKLGPQWDICHTIEGMSLDKEPYGVATVFMKRPI